MFEIKNDKGFFLKLDNGLTISNQLETRLNNIHEQKSETIEIAIFDKNGNWITDEIMRIFKEDYPNDVWCHVDINKWIKIIDICNNYNV